MSEKPYLEEQSLGRFLRERLDPDIVADRQIPGLAQKFRPDYRSERFKLIIEFDGNQHYQRAEHVIKDSARDAAMEQASYAIVRIPYFVQLTPPVICQLLGDRVADTSPFKDFPHGFIADTVVFPADFCELGIARFERDLDRFSYIAADIIDSLANAVESKGDWRLVFPPSMRRRINEISHPSVL